MTCYATPSQLSNIQGRNLILMLLFCIHYTNRDLIYPLRLRDGKPTPFVVWWALTSAVYITLSLALILTRPHSSSLALTLTRSFVVPPGSWPLSSAYGSLPSMLRLLNPPTPPHSRDTSLVRQVYNGFMQTRYLLDEAPVVAPGPMTFAGVALWALGLAVNVHADNTLINLRKVKKGTGDYKIPRGGLFEYVSAANYFGEIVEWTGYAVASGFALPCVAFALFTFANLFPRALAYHRFYLNRFPSYRTLRRKACIPYLV